MRSTPKLCFTFPSSPSPLPSSSSLLLPPLPSLPSSLPSLSPHSHYDTVFIYSSPGFKSSIKERMLYASCKEPLISIVEEKLGLPIAKKVSA